MKLEKLQSYVFDYVCSTKTIPRRAHGHCRIFTLGTMRPQRRGLRKKKNGHQKSNVDTEDLNCIICIFKNIKLLDFNISKKISRYIKSK